MPKRATDIRKDRITTTLVIMSIVAYLLVLSLGAYILASVQNYDVNATHFTYGAILFFAGLPLGYAFSRNSKSAAVIVLGTVGLSLLLVIPALLATFLLAWRITTVS